MVKEQVVLDSSFFNAEYDESSQTYDRQYDAEDFTNFFKAFYTDGVFVKTMSDLQVQQQDSANWSVKVKAGSGFIQGKMFTLEHDKTFVPTTTSSLRTDFVVVELSQQTRDIKLKYIEDEELLNLAGEFILVLAKIQLSSEDLKITQSHIKDFRGDIDFCGMVSHTISSLNFSNFYTELDSFIRREEQQFYEWFEHIKDNLTNNQAGNLQNQIDSLNGAITSLKQKMFPVGYVYISMEDTSPASLFGGQWLRLENRFLLGSGDLYSLGLTGGERMHLLTAEESGLPAHDHDLNRPWSDGSGSKAAYTQSDQRRRISVSTKVCSEKNAELPHNNMPPYIVVNMWRKVGN